MSVVFYRKYRSQDFSSLKGQTHIKDILTHAITNDKISHAYLFCGPRGTGKTSTARIFAKAINCVNFAKNGDVCNECEFCELINSGTSVDVVEMDAASNRGIEEIRSLKESAIYLPTMLKRKIYIIDEAHMLTKEAFNALLKTLEEPPEHILFILATTEPHKLPVTILSRVQRYDFSLAQKDEVIEKLSFIAGQEGLEIEEGVLELIYQVTGGSFRDAESVFNTLAQSGNSLTLVQARSILGVVDNETLESLTSALQQGTIPDVLSTFELITQKIQDYDVFVDYFISYLTKQLSHYSTENPNAAYILMVKELLGIKYQLRDTRDKRGLVQFVLIKIARELSATSSQLSAFDKDPNPKPQIPKFEKIEESDHRSSIIDHKKETEAKVQKPETNKQKQSSSQQPAASSFDITTYLKAIEAEDKRLAAILKGSAIVKSDEILEVRNEFDFNVKHVNKPASQQIISGLLKKEGITKVVAIKSTEPVSTPASTATADPLDVAEDSMIDESVAHKEEQDNSDLVESLL